MRGRSNNGIGGRNWKRSLRNGRESIVGRALAEAVVYQPEPMVCDSLDLIKVVPLISDPTKTPEEIIDVFAMAVTTTLENHRVLVLKLLVLKPLFTLSPHDGLELITDQVDRAVEVHRQVHERLDTLVLDVFDNLDSVLLHERDLRSQSLHVVLQTLHL